MPTYEYYCPANDRRVEVKHGMSQSVKTWGELCRLAGEETQETSPTAPVERAITAGYVATSNPSAKSAKPHACGSPGCCH